MKTMYLLLEITIVRILPCTFFFAGKCERTYIKVLHPYYSVRLVLPKTKISSFH